jgi:organic hydroperoxide reductase OsmC/OhrA
MSDIETTTVCEEGYVCENEVGDFAFTVDATGEEGPTANQVLVADYASCWLPAFRVGASQRGYDDVGKVQIDASADLDDDDDLVSISWTLHVEADIDDDELDEIIERANDICHVHSAVREGLHPDVEAYGDAF